MADNNNQWVVTFPDAIAWAFNPNYIEITAPSGNIIPYLEVTVGNNPAIKAVLYNGRAKIYISRLLQICFASPKTERVKTIHIEIWTPEMSVEVPDTPASNNSQGGGGDFIPVDAWDEGNGQDNEGEDGGEGDTTVEPMKIAETDLTAVWGGINLGERAFNYGVYSYEQGHGWLTSHVQCFINFPFTLELLVANNSTLNRRAGSSGYSQVGTYNANQMVTITKNNVLGGRTHGIVTYRQDISPNGLNTGGTFDTSFDYTFHTPADTTVITHVHLRQEKEGYYLRWVNHFGFIQYYLFDKGDKTTKTEKIANIPEETKMDGMYFGNSLRGVGMKSSRNLKMCAVNLNEETLTYVQDIVSSPFVDLYIGLDKHGHEIWLPVRVSDKSYTVKTLHNYLSDFEIEIEMPDNVTQRL